MEVDNIIKSLVLTRIKIFTFKDLWLFLLGILFVSMTSGALGAFMLGISQEEFFIDEADNIVVITEPGVTTPFTGKVPELLQDDIYKIKGVLAISAETLGISVAQNLGSKAVIVRGVSQNFTLFSDISLIEGEWFDPIIGNTSEIIMNGGVIGQTLKQSLNVKVGDHLQLVSTLTNFVVDVTITGVIQSNSPLDEELLVSLPLGQQMTGKQEGFVSFLRVLLDTNIIDKETLNSYLNEEFSVTLRVVSNDPRFVGSLTNTSVVLYTPTGQYLETKAVGDDHQVTFQLRFGTYEFVAKHTSGFSSQSVSVFVNQTITSPVILKLGWDYYNLTLNVLHNGNPAVNATVELQKLMPCPLNYTRFTDAQGIVSLPQILGTTYRISINYQSISTNFPLNLNRDYYLTIPLESSLALNFQNITTHQEIPYVFVQIKDPKSLDIVYSNVFYSSGTKLFLEPGQYLVECFFEGVNQTSVLDVYSNVSKTVYFGKSTLTVSTFGEDNYPLASSNVTITRFRSIVSQGLTDAFGQINMSLNIGFSYNITVFPASDPSNLQTKKIFFNNLTSIPFFFLDTYYLCVTVFNGTKINRTAAHLEDVGLSLFNKSSLVNSGFSNVSGQLTFKLSNTGRYILQATFGAYQWIGSVDISTPTTFINVSLGSVKFRISTLSMSYAPIRNVEVRVLKGTQEVAQTLSSADGSLEFILPLANYSFEFLKESYSGFTSVTLHQSTIIDIVHIVKYCGIMTFKFTNQYYQNLNHAYVQIQNFPLGTSSKGFTNANGEISFRGIPWGNYSVHVTLGTEIFPSFELIFDNEQLYYEIEFEMLNPILNTNGYSWQRNSVFSVVLSSEFVSGFLKSSLSVFTTTFASLIIIIAVLSLLSIASVISHPIVANKQTLWTFQQLGSLSHS